MRKGDLQLVSCFSHFLTHSQGSWQGREAQTLVMCSQTGWHEMKVQKQETPVLPVCTTSPLTEWSLSRDLSHVNFSHPFMRSSPSSHQEQRVFKTFAAISTSAFPKSPRINPDKPRTPWSAGSDVRVVYHTDRHSTPKPPERSYSQTTTS